MCKLGGRDHNATSYSTETITAYRLAGQKTKAEIITLRAIALKLRTVHWLPSREIAEIITLRAIALKLVCGSK